MQATVNSYLKFVPFSNFNLWDVKRYYNKAKLNFKNVVILSDILVPYRKPVSKADMLRNKWQIISKINFSGELFLRGFEEISSYKGNLNLVPENSIIYSKINVRHGCIYYHDNGKTPFGVSSEYPTYTFDENKISGKFLHKILRSDTFKKLLNTKTSGISKARVKQDEFLDIQIPLPALKEQEKIINCYERKMQEVRNLQAQSVNIESEKEEYLFGELGIKVSKSQKQEGFISEISFQDIERWSVDFIKQNLNSSFIFNGKYAPVKLKEIIEGYQYGLSVKASTENVGIPMLRMNNINNSDLYIDDLKYIPKTNEIGKFILNKGDLLFNRTNSKELVGKTAVFDLDGEFTFASYLIRVVINPKLADCDYINFLFNSPILQFQKDLVSRQITGQANINAQEMREFLFPLPSLDKQKEIANTIKAMKNKITDYNSQAEQKFKEAEQEFENQIFS